MNILMEPTVLSVRRYPSYPIKRPKLRPKPEHEIELDNRRKKKLYSS